MKGKINRFFVIAAAAISMSRFKLCLACAFVDTSRNSFIITSVAGNVSPPGIGREAVVAGRAALNFA